MLRALGLDIDRPAEAAALLGATVEASSCRLADPVVAVREGEPLRVTLRMPKSVDPDDVWIGLPATTPDTGDNGDFTFGRAGGLGTKADKSHHRAAGTTGFLEWTFDLGAHRLRPGYHRLVVEAPSGVAHTTVICAPRQCPLPARSWGVSIPLYALRSAADWGVGSFADMARLARFARDLGAGFLSTLPVCAVFDDVPFADPSPYMPASRLAWNDVYVDIEQVPELASSSEACAEIESDELRDRVRQLRQRRYADPRAVVNAKRNLLVTLARSLMTGGSRRREEFERYATDNPRTVSYASFRSVCAKTQKPFRDWGERDAPLPGKAGDFGAVQHDAVALGLLYGQWVSQQQLALVREAGVGLHLDIPVGVHPSGFDLWSDEESFALRASGGAPPDDFFAGGQLWGFAPLHPTRIRDTGYRYFSSALRHSMRVASSVRIDHVMGLHRMYWVPDGCDPSDGAYVRYRADELHAVVVLEAHLAGAAVVGEDLGTVPGSVRRAMEKDRMLRSFVFEFSSKHEDPLPQSPEWSIASLATHDLAPFASYWRALDIAERRARDEIDQSTADTETAERSRWRAAVARALGAGDGDDLLDDESVREILTGCLERLASDPARLVLVDLEDLWIETERQNRPGTPSHERNFLRRAGRSIEEIEGDRMVVEILENVARARNGLSPGHLTTPRASRADARPVPMGG